MGVGLCRVVAQRVDSGGALHLEELVHEQPSVLRLGDRKSRHHGVHPVPGRPDDAVTRNQPASGARVRPRRPWRPGMAQLDASEQLLLA
jgi:hypothetical protein